MITWNVVPLCEAQLKDVRKEDVLHGGLFRMCDTYRGGGGYDQFNAIYEKRTGKKVNPRQFVVQLKGCPLKCPYCYVTAPGVHGEAVDVATGMLLSIYESMDVDVFHLMGGAPAIYLENWKRIAHSVEVFHSDFLLVEQPYNMLDLVNLPGLHAVSIKEEALYNPVQRFLLDRNLFKLQLTKVNFYLTFTGDTESMEKQLRIDFDEEIFEDSFHIDIINYEALASDKIENKYKLEGVEDAKPE
jgi:hypothetical protein